MPRLVLVHDDVTTVLEQKPFLDEASLQTLLEEHPELIALDDVDPSASALMPIGREVGLAGQSLDLLFIDAGGRLVAVETKLRRNPEVRREVIGQVLEYGAYLSSWTIEDVEAQSARYLSDARTPERFRGQNLYEALSNLAASSSSEEASDEDALREKISDRLAAEDMVLLIAVDRIVDALRQTVTFVNGASRFGMYLLEVQEYPLPDGAKIASLTTFGGVTGARSSTGSARGEWDENKFLQTLNEQSKPEDAAVIQDLYSFIQSEADSVIWGTGKIQGSAGFGVRHGGGRFSLFAIVTGGHAFVAVHALTKRLPMPVCKSFLETLRSLGVAAASDATLETGDWVDIEANLLRGKTDLERFKAAIREMKDSLD